MLMISKISISKKKKKNRSKKKKKKNPIFLSSAPGMAPGGGRRGQHQFYPRPVEPLHLHRPPAGLRHRGDGRTPRLEAAVRRVLHRTTGAVGSVPSDIDCRNFPRRIFPSEEFSQADFSQWGIFPGGFFPVRNFPRRIFPSEEFSQADFSHWGIFPGGVFPVRSFPSNMKAFRLM